MGAGKSAWREASLMRRCGDCDSRVVPRAPTRRDYLTRYHNLSHAWHDGANAGWSEFGLGAGSEDHLRAGCLVGAGEEISLSARHAQTMTAKQRRAAMEALLRKRAQIGPQTIEGKAER
jgi:hypothetical protein